MSGPASIRFRTAVALSMVVTLLWLAAATATSRLLMHEMAQVFDSALQETGQRILQLAVIDVLSREEEGVTQHVTALDTHEEYFTYLVRDAQGRVLLSSHNAAPDNFPRFAGAGFYQTADFRFYQEMAVQGTVILTIAEPLLHRQAVARDLVLGLALPLVAVIPLSLLGIFSALGFGLRPLGQLRQQLARRDANELAPLATQALPSELRPIAGAVNQLFVRLGKAFDAERSFAANAAHELRTPLAGAVVQLQRLRQQTREPDTARRADEIELTLKRLTRLSERLVQLSRAEGARLLTDTPQDLSVVLRLVLQDFDRGPDAGRAQLTLPPAPVLSQVDPDAVAIVARNLIENALRHGDGGSVRVALSSQGELSVENDCATVSPQELAALSGRFVRGIGSGEGSGLGLAIVETIADRIGTPLQLSSPILGQQGGFRAALYLGRRA
ncbi:ATP-binding protein [Cypionkella sp.]|uniref:ATP-binding protein n=1 Tax=Cypionkella sp. TaxID=2811411 RepID=UPI002770AB64|nr:ATP-binding protein [Cypionkella sp.]